MSWRDRPYSQDQPPQPELRLQFKKPSSAVMWLIIANVVIFFLDVLSQNFAGLFISYTFGLSLERISSFYIWQPVTYMFLHANVTHVLFNMIGLYICGTEFEKTFGQKRLLQFYFTCGIVGGLAYAALPFFDAWNESIPFTNTWHYDRPLVGASGGVYGLLLAAIIFFPHIQVILFIIPMPIRVFGLIILAILLLNIISPGRIPNRGGEVCHIAGAVTALIVFHAWGIMPQIRFGTHDGTLKMPFGLGKLRRTHQGTWEQKQRKLAAEQVEVDRILAKVHQSGISSLTRKEKNILQKATKRQNERDRQFGRSDQL